MLQAELQSCYPRVRLIPKPFHFVKARNGMEDAIMLNQVLVVAVVVVSVVTVVVYLCKRQKGERIEEP